MTNLSRDDIRFRFSNSTTFNEIFDAFQSAIQQGIDDIELYRLLFWNDSLTADEIILFGEKLTKVFPPLRYDVYMWMANVFEAVHGTSDNFERALEYYEMAAAVEPSSPDPYIDACDSHDPDLNIPPAKHLIDFLLRGLEFVVEKRPLYLRLMEFYQIVGDNDLAEYYRQKAEEASGTGTR
jgi:tetratricopeptide (TPR) repeat protein